MSDAVAQAIAQAEPEARIRLPFDGGLWRWTALDAYVDSLRPRWLAAPLHFFLRRYAPSAALGNLMQLLLPWAAISWRLLRRRQLTRWTWTERVEALKQHPGPVEVEAAYGTASLVRSLLRRMGLKQAQVIRQSADAPPQLSVIGRQATQIPLAPPCDDEPLGDVYMPLWYTREIKRPGARYITRGILMDDFAFWLLAASWAGLSPWAWPLQAAALGCLLLGFWCIYEIGYRENDQVAIKYESNPTLSENIDRADERRTGIAPWAWAVGLGLTGGGLMQLAAPERAIAMSAAMVVLYLAMLVGVRVAFHLFNSKPKPQRVWVFPWLHLGRNFAFVPVIGVTPLGATLLLANVLARTVPYSIYRLTKVKSWQNYPEATLRTGIVLTFGILMFTTLPEVQPAQIAEAGAILLWCLYRARHELKELRGRVQAD